MADPYPVRRVGQLGDRYPHDRGRLARVHRPDRTRRVPPSQHRRHQEVARRQVEGGAGGQDPHTARIEPDLLPGLPDRGRGRGGVGGVGRPAGKGRLAGMAAQVRRAFDEQDVGPVRAVTDQHEDGRGTSVGRV